MQHIHTYKSVTKTLTYKGNSINLENLQYCKECDGFDEDSYNRYVKAQEELVKRCTKVNTEI